MLLLQLCLGQSTDLRQARSKSGQTYTVNPNCVPVVSQVLSISGGQTGVPKFDQNQSMTSPTGDAHNWTKNSRQNFRQLKNDAFWSQLLIIVPMLVALTWWLIFYAGLLLAKILVIILCWLNALQQISLLREVALDGNYQSYTAPPA